MQHNFLTYVLHTGDQTDNDTPEEIVNVTPHTPRRRQPPLSSRLADINEEYNKHTDDHDLLRQPKQWSKHTQNQKYTFFYYTIIIEKYEE